VTDVIGLTGVGKPNSVSVRHPVHLRYPASAGRPPSEAPSPTLPCTTATSFASIRLDLGLAIYRNYDIYLPLRHVPCPAHIGIGTLITKRPSHSTVHTDRVYGGSADQAG
jgi:hypothetical protein